MARRKNDSPDLTRDLPREKFEKRPINQAPQNQVPPIYGGYQNPYQQPIYPQNNPYMQQGYGMPSQPYPQQVPEPEPKPLSRKEQKKLEKAKRKEAKRQKEESISKSRIAEYQDPMANNGDNEDVPPVEDNLEKKYRRKERTKIIVRAILIFINLALLGYLCYGLTTLFMDLSKKKSINADSYITLCGLSTKESKKIYDKYLIDGKPKAINDYAVSGDALYLSDYAISLDNLSTKANDYFVNVCSSIKNNDWSFSPIVKHYVDLDQLDDGSYIFFPDGTNQLGRIAQKKGILETFYLPTEEAGVHKQITLRNNSISPALVVEVKTTPLMVKGQADVTFYVEKSNSPIPNLGEGIKTNVCTIEDGYGCLYESKAPYVFDLTRNVFISPYYEQEIEGFTKDTLVNGYEADGFIREVSGYITSAGRCVDDSTCEVRPYLNDNHIGPKAFVLDKDNEDLSTIIKKLLFNKAGV